MGQNWVLSPALVAEFFKETVPLIFVDSGFFFVVLFLCVCVFCTGNRSTLVETVKYFVLKEPIYAYQITSV